MSGKAGVWPALETRATPSGSTAPDDDWRQLRAGRAGLAVLFARHRDYVFRLSCGLLADAALAEDATQEVFLRVARGHRRWRPRARFRTLLHRLTVNTCRELGRTRRRRRDLAARLEREPTAATATPPGAPPDPDPLAGPLPPALRRALAALPERQREAVVLRYFEDLDTREAARAMGCHPGTVKTHLHRALAALRGALTANPPSTPHHHPGDDP